MKELIIISGPTASGKTSNSIELARKIGAEIINFDSLLFYQELNIGTAKPTREERAGVPHHLIDIRSVKTPLNAADFCREAVPLLEKLYTEFSGPLILVGGSGFYLRALIQGMYESVTTDSEITTKSEVLFDQAGIDPFLDILKENDPDSFEKLHKNDHYRIRRAVEHFWSTGIAFSESSKKLKRPEIIKMFNITHYYLNPPKDEHLKIIEHRSLEMLKLGLIDEVKALLARKDIHGNEKPLLSIGYKQVQQFLNNEFRSEEELLERIIIATRQLAKAQRTWFASVEEKFEINPLNKSVTSIYSKKI